MNDLSLDFSCWFMDDVHSNINVTRVLVKSYWHYIVFGKKLVGLGFLVKGCISMAIEILAVLARNPRV